MLIWIPETRHWRSLKRACLSFSAPDGLDKYGGMWYIIVDSGRLRWTMAKRQSELPEVLTTPEACRFLRIDKRTYYTLIESGRIKAQMLGRGYKVLKKTLVEFLEAGSSGRRGHRKRKR